MKKPIPFAILSDAPDCPSGFGRITRDLAWHIYRHMPELRVGTIGYWGRGSRNFPWPQYLMGDFREDANLSDLPIVWNDFAGDQPGILFTIYDAARLILLAMPEMIEESSGVQVRLKNFLLKKPFKLWGYFPIDAYGVHCKLTQILSLTIKAFDRVLAYGPFGKRVIADSTGLDVEQLPHGYYAKDFHRTADFRSTLSRPGASVFEDNMLLGVVATNQPRKDWGTVFKVLAQLHPTWKLWAHTDKTIGAWSFPALAEDFGVQDRVFVTQGLDDGQLARFYSSCNVTFAPGLGEGFGYPIIESIACGTRVVHVDYAGGADLPIEPVYPIGYRLDSVYGFKRPVLHSKDVCSALEAAAKQPTHTPTIADPWEWTHLWPRWKRWLQAGL